MPTTTVTTTGLDSWLKRATRKLSRDSSARVRTEIEEHYESAREAAIHGGASLEQADHIALTALGDAATANCQYRNVLLTAAEARLLRQGNSEARAICSHGWMKWVLLIIPATAIFAANELYLRGSMELARTLLAGGIGIGFLFAAPFLPIYTPARGRVFRYAKWGVLLALLGVILGRDAFQWSWLLFSSLWPIAWIELTRVSIRRKLPVNEWPKQLYL